MPHGGQAGVATVVTNHEETRKQGSVRQNADGNGKISEFFTLREPYNTQTKIPSLTVSSLSSVKYQWPFMSNGNVTAVKGYTYLSVEQV